MNRLLFNSIMILLMITEIYGQWEILNELNVDLNTIDFVSENIGWIAGGKVFMRTEDGGISWQSISVEENLSIDRCDFINESSGWAFGWSKILKTTDGGHNWSIIKEMPADFDLTSLQVLNDSTVYVIGNDHSIPDISRGFIWKTSDGGSTWMDISPDLVSKHPNNIWFINSNTGILMCDIYIFRTSDGGVSWEEEYLWQFTSIYDLQFCNDSTAFFLAENDRKEYFLCASSDTLRTWMIKTRRTALMNHYPIQSYYALDENVIFAVMEDSTGQHLMKSTDAGTNWEQISFISEHNYNYYYHLYMKKNRLGFLFGRFELFGLFGRPASWSSTDGGNSWQLIKFSYPLKDVFFIDQYTGYLAGGGYGFHRSTRGRMFKSEDGGETWNFMSGLVGPFITSCQFINQDVGFTRVSDGAIFKTNDGGDSWHIILISGVAGQKRDNSINVNLLFSDYLISKASFLDEFAGWAVGRFSAEDSSGAFILGTVDGGENWDVVFTRRNTETEEFCLNSVNVIDSTVWAVGEYGLMAKSTGNNYWQLQTNVTDLPLNIVFFSDEQHGWIAGGYSDENNRYVILLRTNDGGATWQKIAGFDYAISDMYFKDNLHGWAIGSDTSSSGIIYTEDGGYNWTFQIEGFGASLNALHFKDGFGWAVGENGLVLRTKDGMTWVDQNNGKTYPGKFTLSQNYPNPFNPSTTIEFTLPKSEFIELNIYNILGRKVSNLVSSKLNQGKHNYTFDGENLASGIYYYQLVAGDYREVRKMILLK